MVFMGYIPANAPLYSTIQRAGFEIEFREVRVLKDGTLDNANIDTDLVCYALDNKSSFDKAVIVADDSDFLSLIKTLYRQDKLQTVISTHSLQYTSRDIRKVLPKDKLVSIEAMRTQIAHQKTIAA
jgi:NYN domain